MERQQSLYTLHNPFVYITNDFMFQLTKDEWRELITICDNLPDGFPKASSQPKWPHLELQIEKCT